MNVNRLAVILLFAVLIAACGSIDPLGPRVCECELLKEWVYDLAILPGGNAINEGATVEETNDRFQIYAASAELAFDDRHKQTIIDAFRSQGLRHEVHSESDDRWSVTFYPQSSTGRIEADTPWRFTVTYTKNLSLVVDVRVDGSAYGINDLDELWQSYNDDRQAALDIQQQRQRDALSLLEPISQAADSMVD